MKLDEMRAHLDEGGKLSHQNAVDLLDEFERFIEAACGDINQAHDELMKAQGTDPTKHDWPEWTPQANTIRWGERLLGKRLAKTTAWTLFPKTAVS